MNLPRFLRAAQFSPVVSCIGFTRRRQGWALPVQRAVRQDPDLDLVAGAPGHGAGSAGAVMQTWFAVLVVALEPVVCALA